MANEIFFARGDSPEMINAFKKAQDTFKYFWRELSWEYRRIVPALNFACVKVAFSQQFEPGEDPVVEHMWINNIDFDGEIIKGILVNDPGELTNINNGDAVEIPVDQISDWLYACNGETYGGFTIQVMRSQMDEEERMDHDNAWGLDFGDFNNISIVYEEKEHPENLIEHPMSKNMKDSLVDFLNKNPEEISKPDESGSTLLHRETIAGNLTSVEVLLSQGADRTKTNNEGKTALDYAKQLNWEHIIPVLEN